MLHRWSIFIILAALFSSGCRSTPPPTVTVIPVPTFTPTPAPAMTITATITATAPLSTIVESAREPSADTPLPAPLYFLSQQGQIMRLEADGVTVQPVTTEAAPITAFDVDPTGAYLVYVSNNDLIRTNAWGQQRHLLLAGGPPAAAGTAAQWKNNLLYVAFAPDGKGVAFVQNGIQLIRDISVLEPIVTMETLLSNGPEPELLPGAQFYFLAPGAYPTLWSPDSKRLFITGGRMATDSMFQLFLDLTTHQLTEIQLAPPSQQESERSQQSGLPCYTAMLGTTQRWARTAMTLWSASDFYGMFGSPGLTKFNALDGTVTPLFYAYPACHGDTTGDNAKQVRLFRSIYESTTGVLWGFVNTTYDPERPLVTPMQMVQFDPISVQITPLRTDSHYLGHEILWAEDDRGAVVITRERVGDALIQDRGNLLWLPSDGEPAFDLGVDGRWLRWGYAGR